MEKRFDGQVAVITACRIPVNGRLHQYHALEDKKSTAVPVADFVHAGAGGGLGRAYALAFAARGARVVVNDLGVALAGDSGTTTGIRAADAVVQEIRQAGGEAVANYDDVVHGARIIEAAINSWGRIDILINNAGILRDSSFAKMSERDWDLVMQVHVKGAFACTKAAWPHMMKQGYGRIVNTASASGLYGNFGQANYSAAKMALVGLGKTLAAEGAKYNIKVNCIAPLAVRGAAHEILLASRFWNKTPKYAAQLGGAGTRMTESIMPPALVKALKPECVAPVVLYLSSKDCTETGQVYEVGAGWVAAVRWQRSPGKIFPSSYTLEDVSRDWQHIGNFNSNVSYPSSLQDSLMMVSQQLPDDSPPANDQDKPSTPAQMPPQQPPPAEGSSQMKSAKIFSMIAAFLEQATDAATKLKCKVNSCFHFKISPQKGEPATLTWTIDLRNEGGKEHFHLGGKGHSCRIPQTCLLHTPAKTSDASRPQVYLCKLTSAGGRAVEGLQGTPDATFSMADDVFVLICLGQLNPQVAFLQGKMKILGSMAKATKFTPDLFPPISADMLSADASEAVEQFMKKFKQPASKGSDECLSPEACKLKSAQLFPFMKEHLKSPAGAALVKQVGCVYRMDLIPNSGGTPFTVYLNLKKDPPTIREMPHTCEEPFDCCFTMKDDVFFNIATGKSNPQLSFLQGKMKIKGSTQAALRFTKDMFPKISKL